MKIGLFGGGFNPVHNGHINLAKCYMDYLKLDKIIFIPTAMPPHKTDADFVSGSHRINMLTLAVEDIDNVQVSDIEFTLTEKSYTYNTVCLLKQIYPDDDLYLIIGSDQFFNFKTWYRYQELLQMVTLCTASRLEQELHKLEDFAKNDQVISECNYIVSSFPVVEVSSSQIRQMAREHQDISHLVPPAVDKYIKDNKLYV